ncbi:MAG: phosphoribosylanthranilate isomerase [Gammaproteobacteria bacterium]|nr:phosphoribosylanthranilate isomerase [Pseudomonadales bacterium]MCP5346060.1 phosphoribosylanthranilate isomerase [Pseudomonadales bacterium]
MSRRRIKICGITRAEDARLAADLGADALGLVFHPASSRALNPDSIANVVGRLPAFVTVVGLFVDPELALVQQVLETGLVQCLQFHGNESVDFCRSFGVPFIKAIRVRDLDQARRQLQPFQGQCSVILDAYVKGRPGGTGEAFDWSLAKAVVSDGHNPVILAGGLTPENVASAIAAVSPYGVDVSTGVEQRPGIKDPDKLRRFFDAVYN